MEYIFLIAAFNALFFAFLIFQKKKALHDKILIAWLIYLALFTGTYALFSNQLFTRLHLLSASFVSLLLLHGPFLYFYLSALIKPNVHFRPKTLLHFLPFLLFNLYIAATSFFPETASHIRLDHAEQSHAAPALFNFFLLLTVISGPVYFLLSIRLFRKLDINIFNNFSSFEDVNLDWLRKLTYTFGVIWTALMIFATLHHVFQMFSWTFCTHGLTLSLSVFIILIGYYGLRQKEIFVHHGQWNTGGSEQYETVGNAENNTENVTEYVTVPKHKYSRSSLKEAEAEQYITNIKAFMDTEKPWLEPGLSLPDLAHKLNMPAHILSRVINEHFGVSFFDFINQYRIEEVKSRLNNPAYNNLSLLGIAFDCGFNTKSAFNRVFKNITGLTPSEYRKP